MSEVVIELTERVRKDYRAFPRPIQKKFKSNCGSSPRILVIPRSIFIAYAVAATIGSFT